MSVSKPRLPACPGPRTGALTPPDTPRPGRALFPAGLHGTPALPEPQAPTPAGGSSSGRGRAALAPGRAPGDPHPAPGPGLPQTPPARQQAAGGGNGPARPRGPAPSTAAGPRRVPPASPAYQSRDGTCSPSSSPETPVGGGRAGGVSEGFAVPSH